MKKIKNRKNFYLKFINITTKIINRKIILIEIENYF